jgi:radical SAM superfamily enzyme YgiQ (UPF0313 family)
LIDIVFINPSNSKSLYQGLATKLSAIEPPTWALLLAQSVRAKGFTARIIDANAEGISDEELVNRVEVFSPRLICLVVYGQNVNAGTAGMSGASRISKALKERNGNWVISLVGSYVQALPIKCLEDESQIDFGFTNEGVYALWNVLSLPEITPLYLKNVKGIVIRDNNRVVINKAEIVVPTERMDIDLPGYAWDLLPQNQKPLDLYRAPLWHGEYDEEKRSPYAAIQSSLGCNFGCSFCMINIINRNDENEIGVASDYVPLCEKIASRPYSKELRMWAYSRIDTVSNPEFLQLVRSAGIKWLCLGIESAERSVRLEVSKGKFQDVDIQKVVQQIHNADIEIMANYIVGLPGENRNLMQKTLDLSLELCTSGWNMYAAMALPGSALYKQAVEKGYSLPESYVGYSFHAYETVPMPTEHLLAHEILEFRDQAFIAYHSNMDFRSRIMKKFGEKAIENIEEMLKVSLRRKIIEESKL